MKKLFHLLRSPNYFQESATWSLLSYLKYRERTKDFTGDRSSEHQSYIKNLEYLQFRNIPKNINKPNKPDGVFLIFR
jgi:hypothetical protein